MGRPLYTSVLLARHAMTSDSTQAQSTKPAYPLVEKWSRWNAFDPDSEEFNHSPVYEAFLSEEEIAERAQSQQRESARLLTERLLREAEAEGSSSSSSVTSNSEPVTFSQRISVSRPATVQMEVDVQTVTETSRGDASAEAAAATTRESADGGQESGRRREGPPAGRRPPRRHPVVSEWHLAASGGDVHPGADITIPRISVVPVEPPREGAVRSPSPDPLNLVSGLQYLSESPRPLVPVDAPLRSVSPMPNVSARVSGVFATPPSPIGSVSTPSPAPAVTPRILSWGSRSMDLGGQWIPESPTPAPRAVPRYLEPRLPSAPAPLTY